MSRLINTKPRFPLSNLAWLAVLVLVPYFFPTHASAAPAPKKVMIFSGTDPNLPTIISISQIIRSTLESGWPGRVQFYSEALDNHRIPDEKFEPELLKLLQRKYEGEKIDLIFILGAQGLRFFARHKSELLPDTPRVFIHTNEREADGIDAGPNATGVHGTIELKPALELALSLHPGTRRIVVITGNAGTDKFWETRAHAEFLPYENQLEFVYLTNTTIPELRQALGSQPPQTIVFFLSFLLDREGNGYSVPEATSLVVPASSAPVYVPVQTGFNAGVVGGRMISFDALGKSGADLGLRVLAGERPQDIPVQSVPSVAIFDWRALQRWGISEASLPPGSDVRFKQLSFWALYKWRIIGAVSVIVFQALLIVALLINQRRRKKAEEESARFARLAADEHQRLDEVISNTPGIVWESSVLVEGGKLVRNVEFVNDYIEQMLGYTVEECRTTPNFWTSVVHREDQESSAQEIAAIIDTGKEGIVQFRCQAKNGRTIWIEAHLIVRCDETGKAVGYRGVAMDISGRKQAEEALQHALEEVSQLKTQLEEENIYLQEEIRSAHNFDEIVGRSDAIRYVHFKIEQVAPTDTTVLVSGETGTGKELVARAIHNASLRRDRPMVKVNCAALSASLIESELFGHERGSFTGATARKIGRFELANGATIFLDEIGELPLELQSKLLRVIQEGEFERLGSSQTIKVDVRIIAATNRDLQMEVRKGRFREDLWYRLNVFPITVPPLKQRTGDVVLLVEHFVKLFAQKLGKEITSVAPAALKELTAYAWPGNIRELANVIERAVINSHSSNLRMSSNFGSDQLTEVRATTQTLEEMEREHITRTLTDSGWRIEGPKGAAKVLGLNPSTLRTRIAKLGIQKPEPTTA